MQKQQMTKKRGNYDFVKNLRTHHQVLFAVIVAFGVVAFWRGAWGVMDVLITPDDYLLSSLISLKLGLVILIGLHVVVTQFLYD